MKNQYAYNIETGLVLRLENSGWINADEEFIYSDELLNLKHFSGVELFKVVNGEILERDQSEIESDSKYKNWFFETNLKTKIKQDFLNAYGSYGSLGSLLAQAKTLFSNPSEIEEITDELRYSENLIDIDNSTNIEYYSGDLTENERGLIYVKDFTKNAVIQTKEIPVSYTDYALCIVATLLECGYAFEDIDFKYKKGTGNWTSGALRGRKPYSVVAKINDTRSGNIKFKLTLTAGNAVKQAAVISFGIVGI